MSGKTKSDISIAYIHIEFNVSAIRDWLKNPHEIGVDKKWSLESDNISHSIDLLVKDDLYFHRDANQYSHLIAGSQYIDDEIGGVEWGMGDGYFYIYTQYQEIVVGKFPLNEVRELLQAGQTNPLNDRKVGEIVDLSEPDEYCKKILKKTWYGFRLIYSNDLTSLNFSIPTPRDVVEYPVGDCR